MDGNKGCYLNIKVRQYQIVKIRRIYKKNEGKLPVPPLRHFRKIKDVKWSESGGEIMIKFIKRE